MVLLDGSLSYAKSRKNYFHKEFKKVLSCLQNEQYAGRHKQKVDIALPFFSNKDKVRDVFQ